MSFGFSIGDIIAVSTLARSLWKGFTDSPDQCKAIRSDVAGLYIVLDDVARNFGSYDMTTRQQSDLQTLVSGCQAVLVTLEEILKKHGVLETKTNGLRAKSKKAWERLKWDQAEIVELRARLTSQASLLDAFNGSIVSQVGHELKNSLKGLNERVESLQVSSTKVERETIIRWLSPLDFSSQHQDFISRRQLGTGQKFLDSEAFQKWLETEHGQIFCPGIPGAGKTIMASTVVDHLQKKFENQEIGILYLYCNYRRKLEQTVLNLLGSLAQQMAQQRPGISPELGALYQKHVDKKSKPDLDEMLAILRSEAARFSHVFIVVDALDECINSYDSQDILVGSLQNLCSNTKTNLLVTSRFMPVVTCMFEECSELEIRAEVEDVKTYVLGNISRMPKFVMRNLELQDAITDAIAKAVHGMFLLAQLHLDSLADKTSPKAMKIALQKLPKGSDALELAYNGAVERIDSQKPGLRHLADQVLSWITYARRPLSTTELQHALAIEIGESYLDEENFSDVEEMINVCAGLVTVDENSKVIRFIHYTTQEYFESIRKVRFPGADDHVALSCISYLTHDDLDVDSFGRFSVDCECAFVEYAADHWGHHAKMASADVVTPSAVRLLRMDKRLRSYLDLTGNSPSTHWQSSPSIALWVAASYGLEDAARQLLSEGADANCKMNGETALYAASCGGYTGVVKVLLDAGSDVELTGGSRGTTLSAAAYHGHSDVVRLLIPRSFHWWRHGTALKEATDGGHLDTVKLLLEEGADIKSPYGIGDNLGRAIYNGSEAVVRLLFDRGATIDPCRAMALAARPGHSNIVQLLIQKQSKAVDAKPWIESGIWAAAAGDHTAIITQLLAARSELNLNLKPALMRACQSGSVQAFKLLLTPRLFRTNWQELLDTAVVSEQEMILQLIFDWGLRFHVDISFGDTLLNRCPANKNIIRILLQNGTGNLSKLDLRPGSEVLDKELDKIAHEIVRERREHRLPKMERDEKTAS